MTATAQGASQKEPEAIPQAQNNPRNDEANDLAALNRERRDQELVDEGIEPVDTSAPVDTATPVDEPPPAVEPTIIETTDDETPTETMLLVVDGVEQEVDVAKVVDAGKRAMQKESSADYRLQEATRLLNEAKAMQPSTDAAPEATTEQPPSYDAAELAHAIQYGSSEQATAAIEHLGMGANATQMQGMDQEKLAPLIQDTIAYNSAVEMLGKNPEDGGFGDLWNDPTLRQLFVGKEKEVRARLAAENEPLPTYTEMYTGIGNELRKWRDSLSPATPDSGSLTSKQARKQGIDVAPVAGGRTSTTTPEDKPKTRAQILAEMSKGRNQDY